MAAVQVQAVNGQATAEKARAQVRRLEDRIAVLGAQLYLRDERIEVLDAELAGRDAHIAVLRAGISDLNQVAGMYEAMRQ